jgi:hypothetical protein
MDPRLFLAELRSVRPDVRQRYADGVRALEAQGQPVPGIWRLFAYKPALADCLGALAQQVLRGPSPLSPGFRELIAATVSSRNHCLF